MWFGPNIFYSLIWIYSKLTVSSLGVARNVGRSDMFDFLTCNKQSKWKDAFTDIDIKI